MSNESMKISSHDERFVKDARLLDFLCDQGYRDFRWLEGQGWCGLQDYMYTCAIVVDMKWSDYKGRYCYATAQEAKREFEAWDGQGDPGGNWIKYKAACEDRLGPGATNETEEG